MTSKLPDRPLTTLKPLFKKSTNKSILTDKRPVKTVKKDLSDFQLIPRQPVSRRSKIIKWLGYIIFATIILTCLYVAWRAIFF